MSIKWWHTTSIYHIFIRSFQDSNNDGIGDLAGILQRLDFLESLGIETIRLSHLFKTPFSNLGFDISDHCGIQKEYGTIEDLAVLIKECHRRNMRILLDIELDYVSIDHEWFKERCIVS